MKRSSRFVSILLIMLLLLPTMIFNSVAAIQEIDLSVKNGSKTATVNGAIWEQFPGDKSAGTGNFNTYLSMQAQGSNTTQLGYNSNRKTLEFDEKKSWTMALPLAVVPVVEVGGILYREFVVDINESKPQNLISLDKFQIWQTNLIDLSGYDLSNYSFPTGASKVYDIDTNGDASLTLDYLVNSGSGWHDYRVLIPNAWFDQSIQYVTMFAYHGLNHRSDTGFEEWGVRAVQPVPAISIDKTTNGSDNPAIPKGDDVTWTYVVTNIGNVTLTSIDVTDDKEDLIGSLASLAPGFSQTFTKVGTAIAGEYTNIGTVIGKYNTTVVTAQDSSGYTGTFTPAPSISITKTTNGSDGLSFAVGTPITWTYVVKNTGNVALTDISVNDDIEGPIGSIESLAPGASETLTKTGIAVEGPYTNTSTAEVEYDGTTYTDTDTSSYTGYVPEVPDIYITKTTNGSDGPTLDVGDPVTWTYEVTNTGNVTLTDISVDDDIELYIGNIASLEPGASATLTKSGTAKEGQYTNIATATGKYGEGETDVVTATDTSWYIGEVPFIPAPSLTIDKTTNDTDGPTLVVGEPIVWSYLVKNTGNVELKNIKVTDDKEGDIGTIASLMPGAETILTTTGKAVKGAYTNTGTAEGWYGETAYTDQDVSNYTGIDPDAPALSINKSANTSTYTAAGNIITYTILVTNTGNTTLTGVTVSDNLIPNLSVPEDYASGILESGKTWTFTGTYTITSEDMNASSLTNTATADSVETQPVQDSVTITRVLPGPTPTPTPTPTPLGSIVITKFLDSNENGTDDGEDGTTGITFELYNSGMTKVGELTTSGSKTLSFSDLAFGTYYVREVLTDYFVTTGNLNADGFSLPIAVNSTTPQTIEIGNQRITVPQEEIPLAPPIIVEVEEDETPLASPVLPATGELPPYFAYGFGSLLMLAGLFFKRKF